MKKSDQTVLFFQKPFFSKDKPALLNWLESAVYRSKKPLVLFTPNPEQLVLAQKNPAFDQLLDRADVLIPDGIGLVMASWLLSAFGRGGRLTERIAGIDVAADLISLTSRERWTTLLVGGRGYDQAQTRGIEISTDRTIDSRGRRAHRSSAKLQWIEGYANAARPTVAEEREVQETITALKPQLVFVALGAPQQEQWVVDHLPLLTKHGAKVVMVVGGAFDILLGRLQRAPLWMRSLGLEWLYRLIQEPWRAGRQVALVEFVGLVVKELFRR